MGKNEETTVHVCPTIVELLEQYKSLEKRYDNLVDKYDNLLVQIRERASIPITTNRNEIEPIVRDIVDDVIEEKKRMGDW